MKTSLCILTKNELPCLEVVLNDVVLACKKHNIENIYAIDGGSIDGTVEFFKKNNIKVLSQKNRGRGDAFHLAFKEIHSDLYIFYSLLQPTHLQDQLHPIFHALILYYAYNLLK